VLRDAEVCDAPSFGKLSEDSGAPARAGSRVESLSGFLGGRARLGA
jgi:hypothetical protein